MKEKKCPLCHEEVFSEIGKGCKMCGMPLEDKSREFCSRKCRLLYQNINRIKLSRAFLLLVVFIATINLASADLDERYNCGMMSGFYGNSIWYFSFIIQILVVVALILALVWAFRGGKNEKFR
jgi:predicted nucleic acid-binding Zn ribbon protein